MGYLAVFLAALAVDTIPVFAPPAWTIMVFLLTKYKLEPWPVIALGAAGSTIGRYLFSRYIPLISRRLFSRKEDENVAFVGKKLKRSPRSAFFFVLLYSLTPLSTTALFTAAGLGRVPPLYTLPAFLIGKFASDAVMVFSARKVAGDLLKGQASPKSIIFLVLGLLVLGALVMLDWKTLLTKKRLKLQTHIFK